MPHRFKFDSKLYVVVHLAVEDDPVVPVVVAHRLMTGRCGVDDGESPMAERKERRLIRGGAVSLLGSVGQNGRVAVLGRAGTSED